ncbi:MAG: AI-2E family transporter [Deltaproteobacteria bacterium]|nr:AI-2E family transporter [Deltaproteobacteria bacterium]
MAENNHRRNITQKQFLVLFLVFTLSLATGLTMFSSISTITAWIRTATGGLFLPILLSLILAFLVEPLVSFLEGENVPRTASILVIFLFLAGLLALLAIWLIPHLQVTFLSLKSDFPRYLSRGMEFVNEFQANVQKHFPFVEHYQISTKVRSFAESLFAQILLETPKSALRFGSLIILVPLFSFFFLRDGRRMAKTCLSVVPNRYFELAHDLYFTVSYQLANFIRGRILEALIIGIVVTLGLSLTDIRYPLLLGIFAGVTNLIPYIGPIIGMIPGFLVAFVDLGMGGQFWWIVIVYFIIAQIILDSFILIPVLISKFADLHPLWVIIAIIMGGKLYGVVGMIIGVPIASIIKITIVEIRHYRSSFQLPDVHLENSHLL